MLKRTTRTIDGELVSFVAVRVRVDRVADVGLLEIEQCVVEVPGLGGRRMTGDPVLDTVGVVLLDVFQQLNPGRS